MDGLCELRDVVGVTVGSAALDLPRSTAYRWLSPRKARPSKPRRAPARKLDDTERQEVLDVLHSERFVDRAPAAVVATLLEEENYLCSVRTMYRILAENDQVRERRDQLRHPKYTRPELVATAPNQVWTWDITQLRGPSKYVRYYLYVMLDLFSRLTVGWMLAHRENAELAKRLLRTGCERQGITPGQLAVHADRGPAPASKSLADLMRDLGIESSHSRPRVSNDNPFSEAHFKTLKYAPDFPDNFESFEHTESHCERFFDFYNNDHRHSALAYFTPADVHYGRVPDLLIVRDRALAAAYERHPERFVNGPPRAARPPEAVYLNPPEPRSASVIKTH